MPVRSSLSFLAKGAAFGLFVLVTSSIDAGAANLAASPASFVPQAAVLDEMKSDSSRQFSGDPSGEVPAPRVDKPADQDGESVAPDEQDVTRPNIDPNAPPPPVEYDLGKLPEPVRQMRERIVQAAKTGSIEALRPLIGTGSVTTDLGGDSETDPIDFLKSLSGDEDGREILAILVDILDSGYVHLKAGTADEVYAWPYFFAYPLDKLTPPQMVELFQIMTAGDYDDMKSYGAYIFYRVGITPDGKWRFFLAGE